MSFEARERIHNVSIDANVRRPPDDGHVAPSLEQVKDTDRNLWILLAKGAVEGGVRCRRSDTAGQSTRHHLGESVNGKWSSASTEARERKGRLDDEHSEAPSESTSEEVTHRATQASGAEAKEKGNGGNRPR